MTGNNKKGNQNYTRSYRSKNGKKKQAEKRRRITVAVIIALVIILLTVLLAWSIKDKNNAGTKDETLPKKSESNVMTEDNSPKPSESDKTTDKTTENTTENTTASNTGSVKSDGTVVFNMDSAYKRDYTYCVAVNRKQNVTTVYAKDDNGEYTKPVKAMLTSCGIGDVDGGVLTPAGSFRSSRKDRWLYLVGNCWGQYTTKVHGSIFFHSVPYYTQSVSDLQYNEFVKLGRSASHGCIRVSTADAKWLYDNLKLGTLIYIYDSNVSGPLGKPAQVPFDVNSPNRGWDPTDPASGNPWKS